MTTPKKYYASTSYEFYQISEVSACQIMYQIKFCQPRLSSEILSYHYDAEVHGSSLFYFSWSCHVAFKMDDSEKEISDDNQTNKAYLYAQAEIILYFLYNMDMLAFHKCSNLTASHKQENR